MSTQLACINLLKELDKAYYVKYKPIVTDAQYGEIRKLIKKRFPKDPYFKAVGSKAGGKREVVLEKIMPHLVKKRPSEAIEWIKNLSIKKWFVSAKMDGISLDVTYVGRKLVKATTRGDGMTGQDVTEHAKMTKWIPQTIAYGGRVIVSGELICSKRIFRSTYDEKHGGSYAAPRNFVGGILNSLVNHAVIKMLRDVHYVVFGVHVVGQENFFATKILELEWAKKQRFQTVLHYGTLIVKREAEPDDIKRWFIDRMRANQLNDFEQDGLVIEPLATIDRKKLGKLQALRPSWIHAIKLDVEDQPSQIGIIDRVEGEMSIRRRYTAVGVLTKPIDFKGAMTDRVSAYNWKNVKDLGLGKGAKVKMIRSGDVIPRILKCLKPGKVVIPTECGWCGSKLKWTKTATDLYCPNLKCNGLPYLRMQHFVSQLDIDGVSTGIIDKVWGKKGLTIRQLLQITPDKLAKIDGIGKIKAKQLVDGLKQAVTDIDHAKLMYASGFFCDENTSLAEIRLQQILDALAKRKILLRQVLLNNKARLHLKKTRGLGEGIINLFIRKLPWFLLWHNEIMDLVTIKKPIKRTGPLKGKSFAFTNFRNYDLIKLIETKGGKVEGIKKTTTALFYAASSKKVEAAEKWGIKCIPQAKSVAYIDKLIKGK